VGIEDFKTRNSKNSNKQEDKSSFP